MNSEQIASAAYNMQEAASKISRAASIMEECTRNLEVLFGQDYGSNLDRLIKALENNTPPIEKPNKLVCVCGFCDGTDCNQ